MKISSRKSFSAINPFINNENVIKYLLPQHRLELRIQVRGMFLILEVYPFVFGWSFNGLNNYKCHIARLIQIYWYVCITEILNNFFKTASNVKQDSMNTRVNGLPNIWSRSKNRSNSIFKIANTCSKSFFSSE